MVSHLRQQVKPCRQEHKETSYNLLYTHKGCRSKLPIFNKSLKWELAGCVVFSCHLKTELLENCLLSLLPHPLSLTHYPSEVQKQQHSLNCKRFYTQTLGGCLPRCTEWDFSERSSVGLMKLFIIINIIINHQAHFRGALFCRCYLRGTASCCVQDSLGTQAYALLYRSKP